MSSDFIGSKGANGAFHTVIGQMPCHSVYVEPFFGRGKIFWEKRRAAVSYLFDVAPDLLARVSAEHGVIVQCGDALSLLPGLSLLLPIDALVYCDPPYPLNARRRPGRQYYTDSLFPGCREMSDTQHAQLLKLLLAMKCRVMISSYPNALYSSHLQSWRCIEYQTRTRGATVVEALWCNFPEAEELHDWRYAGSNFRQRLYYKRLAARWLTKLSRMTPRQRGYVLDAISQRQSWRGATERRVA
jgi:DNA adenine methylase